MKLKNSEIYQDLTKNKLVVTILLIGIIPLWMGNYLSYVYILLLPVALCTRLNATSWIILAFSVAYTLTQQLWAIKISPSILVMQYLFPIILYQTGLYLGKRFKSPDSIITVLILLAGLLALPAVVANIQDFITTGEIVNITRQVSFEKNEAGRSATNYGMMLSVACGGLGVMFLGAKTPAHRRLKYILLTFSVFALFSIIHLLNRTGVVLSVFSIIFVFLLAPHTPKKYITSVFIAIGFAIFYEAYLDQAFHLSDIVEGYISRESGGTTESMGDRDRLWAKGLDHILAHPFGFDEGVKWGTRNSYAHNIILDAGVRGGVLCSVLMLVIYGIFIYQSYRILNNKSISNFVKFVIVSFSVVIVMQSMVEPIIEGLFIFFCFLMIMMGMTKRLATWRHTSNLSHKILYRQLKNAQ